MHKQILNHKAFALVLVMITIALASTIAVFFLNSTGRERRGVAMYARGGKASYLASMAVNRVIAQINLATKEGTASEPASWAAQPGMIRTYNANGNPSKIYKLYSWDNLMENGAGFNPTASSEVPAAGWKNSPAVFTDLNQPIAGSYPILNPNVIGKVDGFSVDSNNSAVAGSGLEVPMPTKWLYVLEDGQMVAPSDSAGTIVTVPGASTANPIVGRIAFWTDDETSKVNINTAGEGAFWDWPKAATYDEMQFAGNPPVGNEFNCVPGHPSMTSLSAVFPELDPGDRWNANYWSNLKSLLALSPRVPCDDSSSRGGTYPITAANFDFGPNGILQDIPSTPLTLKTDRLLAAPDELYFSGTMNGITRTPAGKLTVDMLSQRSFFLTANSRAPETTLFGTPRVSLWPITWPYPSEHAQLPNRQKAAVSQPNPEDTPVSGNTWMRAEERLLAFISSLNQARDNGGERYFFQRQNPESCTHDYANIKRNQSLLSYLQRLTSANVPGYGGNFVSKYTADGRDWILANTFNFVRSLVNQYTLDTDGKMLYSFTPVSFNTFTMANGSSKTGYTENEAFLSHPLKLNLGSGDINTISEFPLLREVSLVFYATQRIEPTKKADSSLNFNDPLSWNNLINVGGAGSPTNYPTGARTTRMRGVMLLDFFNLRGATRNNQPIFWVKITGGNMQANGTSLGFGGKVMKLDYRTIGGTARKMPEYILPFFTRDSDGNIKDAKIVSSGNTDDLNYGLVSPEVQLDDTATEFGFTGDSVGIEIYGIKNGNPDLDPTSDSSLMVAKYTIDFSGWNGPQEIPLAPRWNYFDKMNSKKAVSGNGKSSECPNPNFNNASKWACIEIAPAFRSANAGSDPVMSSNPTSIPDFASIYPKDAEGSVAYPADTSLAFSPVPTYAYKCSAGKSMTDYQQRMAFNLNSTSIVAENGSQILNKDTLRTNNQINPGGFPATTVYDTVLSMVPDPSGDGQGDPRLASKFKFRAIKDVIGSSAKMKQVLTSEYRSPNKQYHTMGASTNFPACTGYIASQVYSVLGKNIAPNGIALCGQDSANGILGRAAGDTATASTDASVVGVVSMRPIDTIGSNASVGDWSSGAGYVKDGGFIPRPDQDFQALYRTTYSPSTTVFTYVTPYFVMNGSGNDGINTPSSKGYFSPNRQIPSPITVLGSLPSSTTQGWRSLLFSPNPAAGSSHPGLSSPPDYLFLDLFWMPAVEPYPISEEFSTAGKINLNYKIMPFSYINRKTGLYALLKSTSITAMDNSLVANYKSHYKVREMADSQTRYPIDPAETLKRFDSDVFDSGSIFRSAAEICSMWMVPKGSNSGSVISFWNNKLLTSDTAREQPYDHLYSRVTTTSNTYTVHWRVQALQKVPSTAAEKWDEAKDRITAELRGSTLIERYIDPNRTDIPDYATDSNASPLNHFYKWRIVSENYFQP
ncbi:MAG: Verru_Chthon cassette protein A [Chthoniobacteraceae bacterium]